MVRLSLPLYVNHSSHLTVTLNTVRKLMFRAPIYHAYAVKFQTKLDYVRA